MYKFIYVLKNYTNFKHNVDTLIDWQMMQVNQHQLQTIFNFDCVQVRWKMYFYTFAFISNVTSF